MTDSELISYVLSCREEAKSAKKSRMDLNRANYDMYHLKHDFSHKKPGQSKEVLSKVKMATEQTRSFFQQALVDIGDWWKCYASDGSDGESLLVKPHEIYKLTNHLMDEGGFYSHIGNCVQSALLGSLAIPKVDGCLKAKPKYVARKKGRGKTFQRWLERTEDKTWSLKFEIIRQEDFYPDPTGAGLYEVIDSEVDLYVVKQLAEEPYALFDKAAVKDLKGWGGDIQKHKKADETGQDAETTTFRQKVKLTELWGNVIDPQTGDLLYENCVITLANDSVIIRKPTPNPNWNQKSPVITAALLEVANSVWHTALMDAGTQHNHSLIEIFNLILDSGMKSVYGINQIRVEDLEDQKQISGGIPFGTNLKVRSSLPPGAKVMESVVSGEVSNSALNVMNILSQEANASMLTNDLRQGVMPSRAVKATEVVEASNTITSVFQGVAKNVETKLIQPHLTLNWQTTAQNWDLIDKEVFIALFGKERGEQLSQLPAEEVFANTVGGVRFEVFGISLTLSKQADFRKYTTLLQTISASETLIEAFLKAGYSFDKMLGEIMTALGIDKSKIREGGEAAVVEQTALQTGAPAPGVGPDQMSQVPSAASASLTELFGGQTAPQPYPGSPAVAGQ